MLDRVAASFGENIRRIRGARTQKEFADLCGVSQSRISDWERGRYQSMDLKSLFKIAKADRISIDRIVPGIDAEYDSLDIARRDLAGHSSRDTKAPAGTRNKAGEDAPSSDSTRDLQRQIANLKAANKQLADMLGEVSVRVAGLAHLLSTYDRRPPQAGSSGSASSRVRRRR